MHRAGSLLIILASLVLILFAGEAIAADAPEIAVEAGAEEIFIGESVDYVVEIRNVKSPVPPDMTAFREDFEVAAAGDESRNQSSTFIINGRVSKQESFGHVFRFKLTPKRTDKLVIPAPSATIDGKTISGLAVELDVVAPEEQDLVIPEIKVSRGKLYPTQPLEVTLRIFIRPLPDSPDQDPTIPLRRRPPHIDVNWVDLPAGLTGEDKARWLEELLAENGSGFTLNDLTMRSASIFGGPRAAVFSLFRGREQRPGLDGRPINYFVYELKRTVTAEKAGMYSLGPAIVKGTFVEKMEGRSYAGRRLVAIAPAVPVEVSEVPADRPATFCGGIGSYRVSASASPTELRVGDPLTLTLDFERGEGSGALELISAPDLAASPQLAENFEIVDKSPTGRTEGSRKRFAYALRPKHAGVGIPALTVAVFNPETEKFAAIATRPVALVVSEASRLGAGDLVGSLAGSGSMEIKSREQGIFQNVTDPTQLRDQNVHIAFLAEVATGFWCAVGCLFAVVTSHRRKSGDIVWKRRQQARRVADRRLAEARAAVTKGEPQAALRAIRAALVGLIADMRNVVAEGLTASEVDTALEATAVPADERAGVLRLLNAVESAEYGSGTASEVPAMVAALERLIPSLTRHLERDR